MPPMLRVSKILLIGRKKTTKLDLLTKVLVQGCRVDTSPTSIRRFLYGESSDVTQDLLTLEFSYRWDMVKSFQFHRIVDKKETAKRCIAQHLSIDREGAHCLLDPRGFIRNPNILSQPSSSGC